MTGPLEGYLILDFSQIVSGPLATMLLADQGADVIKIEPVDGSSDITRTPTFSRGEMSAFYLNLNRGKRCMAVDIASDAGRGVIRRLAAQSDVLVQNFRPGVMERLGLGWGDLRVENQRLVYCSISGFGPSGPYCDRPVLDPVIQGLTGMVARQRMPEYPFPDLVRNLIADKSTALLASQAIAVALLARERSGRGQHLEIPMLDACLYFFWPDGMPDQTLPGNGATSGYLLSELYNLTECLDGHIIYFVTTDQMRHGLYDAVGHPEWKDDPRFATQQALLSGGHMEELGLFLADSFRQLSCSEVLARLVAADVPCGPILQPGEVANDPQVMHNEALQTWFHSAAGEVRQPRQTNSVLRHPGHNRLPRQLHRRRHL